MMNMEVVRARSKEEDRVRRYEGDGKGKVEGTL